MSDEDENLSLLLSMGFPNLQEIKRALRLAKNDLNEAVAILTNDQPMLGPYDPANDIDMDMDLSKATGSSEGDLNKGCDEGGFPTTNLYELEQRVFQVKYYSSRDIFFHLTKKKLTFLLVRSRVQILAGTTFLSRFFDAAVTQFCLLAIMFFGFRYF